MKNSKFSGVIRRILVVLLLAAIAIGIGFIWMQRTDMDDGPLRLYGNVDIREVNLAFRQPGRIAEMMFDEGDAITRGMRMALLNDQPYQDALASAEASVQVAQAELAKLRSGLRPQEIIQAQEALKQAQAIARNAERDYQRQNGLLPSGASSRRGTAGCRPSRPCPGYHGPG